MTGPFTFIVIGQLGHGGPTEVVVDELTDQHGQVGEGGRRPVSVVVHCQTDQSGRRQVGPVLASSWQVNPLV